MKSKTLTVTREFSLPTSGDKTIRKGKLGWGLGDCEVHGIRVLKRDKHDLSHIEIVVSAKTVLSFSEDFQSLQFESPLLTQRGDTFDIRGPDGAVVELTMKIDPSTLDGEPSMFLKNRPV